MQQHVKMGQPRRVPLCNEEISKAGTRRFAHPLQILCDLDAAPFDDKRKLLGRRQRVEVCSATLPFDHARQREHAMLLFRPQGQCPEPRSGRQRRFADCPKPPMGGSLAKTIFALPALRMQDHRQGNLTFAINRNPPLLCALRRRAPLGTSSIIAHRPPPNKIGRRHAGTREKLARHRSLAATGYVPLDTGERVADSGGVRQGSSKEPCNNGVLHALSLVHCLSSRWPFGPQCTTTGGLRPPQCQG